MEGCAVGLGEWEDDVVLLGRREATRRAWSMTEAAYARGFESPHRRPYRVLRMRPADWLLIAGVASLVGLLTLP